MSNSYSSTATRLKDLVSIKGVRENPIIGYGLVVGLDGTGDGGGEITNTALKRMFQQLGLNPQNEVSSNNVASVIVTANLPAFAREGQRIDVTVSSIGSASSLAGGTLLVTPLKGGDGNIYAITSGPISIGNSSGQGLTTTATLPRGAIVERELQYNFDTKDSIRLSLHHPDFTTAARVEKTINSELGGKFASARDATTLDLVVPTYYQRRVVQLMALIENFTVHTDQKARIVINERTGTIVAGGEVKLRPVAISHGDLTIEINNQTGTGDANQEGSLIYMEERPSLNDLVQSLNAIGADPDDIISIFQALRRNGSLIGEIEMI